MRRLLMSILALAMIMVLARPGFGQGSLSITKTDIPDPVIAGNLLTYTLTGTNDLPVAALNLTISDPLPATTVFISAAASAGATLTTPAVGNNGTVTAVWDAAGGTPAGLTAPGVSRTLTIVVRVCPESGCVVLSNTGTISAVGETSVSTTAETTLDVRGDLFIDLDGSQEALRGSTVAYTLDVRNNGPSVLQDIVVSNLLPDGVFATAVNTDFTDAQCDIVEDGRVVTCSFAIGAANQCSTSFASSGTISIEAFVSNSARTSFSVAMVAPGTCGTDPNLNNNQSILQLVVSSATAPAVGDLGLGVLATVLAAAGVRRLRRRSR